MENKRKSGNVKPERPSGFLDYLPADYLAREKIVKIIERVFYSFGYDPIETPRIEFLKTLAGEKSSTGKNIFHIKNNEGSESLAMPFDHTVPFARILAANPYNPKNRSGIHLPWRRMVIGPIFRGEKPQVGRYRQFYQADIDIAGTESMIADAEIISIMYSLFFALGVNDIVIYLNNRKILNGLAKIVGIKARGKVATEKIIMEMMRILDKLDKIGIEAVLAELKKPAQNDFDTTPNLSAEEIMKVKEFLNIEGDNKEKLKKCKSLFLGIKIAEKGIAELEEILKYTKIMGVPDNIIKVNFSIARGLDYYTGPVMETVLTKAPEFGSVFSGGRYNDLVRRFTGESLPATGASLGLDRVFAALDYLGLVDHSITTVSEVMVLRLALNRDEDYLQITREIRNAGFNTEISLLDDTTFKSQFNFAISRGVKFVVICGEDEFKKGTVSIKNLKTRKQEEIKRNNLVAYFKKSA